MNSYRYPDIDDKLTAQFIKQSEPYANYWEESETRALKYVGDLLRSSLPTRSRVRALDVGCGAGRLLPWIATFATDITALDPDDSRFAVARKYSDQLNDRSKITYETRPLSKLASHSYDLIVCNHIIQHIPTNDIKPMLQRLYELTAPGGILILSYSRATTKNDHYSIEHFEEDRVRSTPVDKVAFNTHVKANESGSLPVHYFNPSHLSKLGAELRWKELLGWTFHILDDLGILDRYINRDELANSEPKLFQTLGRDIVTVWKREET